MLKVLMNERKISWFIGGSNQLYINRTKPISTKENLYK